MPSAAENWHLDKKVPVTLILILMVQLATGLWFAARMVQRDEEQERRIAAMEQVAAQQNYAGRMTALEAQIADLKAGLSRIDGKLDRLIERGTKP